MKPGTGLLVDKMSREQREEFEERAGIMEFEAGLSKDDAECVAAITTLNITLPKREQKWHTKE